MAVALAKVAVVAAVAAVVVAAAAVAVVVVVSWSAFRESFSRLFA